MKSNSFTQNCSFKGAFMYLLLHWMDKNYLILDTSTERLGDQTYDTVLEAVTNFTYNKSWCIKERTDRFTLTDTALIDTDEYFDCSHKIIARFDSLDLNYLQQHHPELLI